MGAVCVGSREEGPRAQAHRLVVLAAQVLRVAEQRVERDGMARDQHGLPQLLEGRLDLAGLEQEVGDPRFDLVPVGIERGHLLQFGQARCGSASRPSKATTASA